MIKKTELLITCFSVQALLLLMLAGPLQAQQKVAVRGKVVNSEGTALPGVSVTVKGENTGGTITNDKGEFSTSVFPGVTLVFSMVGYSTQEVAAATAAGQPDLTISMQSVSAAMEEVVVVGYGTTKKVNLTGAVTAISGDDIAKRQVGQTSMALQGMAPGITVTQSTGQPGVDGGTIRIRGIGTLNNADPLILVDGVVMSMDNIDVASIESISVLKDAASSAIYGSRAANGVILITTKRGKKGKFSFNYDAYVGKQSVTDMPDMVNGLDHMQLINEAYTNTGLSPLFPDTYIQEYIAKKDTDPDHYPDTDWRKEVVQGSGMQTNHVLSISGGTDKLQFFGSFGYLNQKGLLEGVNYKRYFARLNTNIKISEKLSGSFDLYVRNTTRDAASQFPGANGAAISATGTALIWGQVNKLPATQAARYTNGLWGEGQNGVNPLAIIKDGGWWRQTEIPVSGNFSLSYKPVDFLTAKVAFSPSYSQPYTQSFVNAVKTYDPNGTLRFTVPALNTFDEGSSRSILNQTEATLTFSKNFNKHAVTALAGYQYLSGDTKGFSAFRDNFLFPEYTVLSGGSASNMKNDGYAYAWTLISYFGRLNYSFAGKYLFEANVRRDGSSRFAPGNKWGTFPSFSVGWRLSEEKFMDAARNWIDDLKIRASWGRLGNQEIGSYYPFAPTVSLDPQYISNGAVQNGAAIMNMANTDISWETTTMNNIGVDARILKDLSITFDYYYKKTTGILLQLSIPGILGVSAPYQNAGVVENKGWDLQIDYSKSSQKFKYGFTFSLSDVKNKILDLKGIQETGTILNREGYPINSLFLLHAEGLISDKDYDGSGNYIPVPQQFGIIAPGDIRYEDSNDDKTVNLNDRKVLGSTIPRFTFGLNAYLSYKNFDFSALFQGVGKRDGYLTGSAITPFLAGGTAYEYQKNRWTKDNPDPNAAFPRYTFGLSNNTQNSDFWMKSAAYLRIKNLQLGYSLPAAVLAKLKINALRIYVSGENIFTFDHFWPGWDPEISAASAGAYYPQVKTFNLGLNLKF
jgi:TonB-linked SusC/RagA family outer membrane protein